MKKTILVITSLFFIISSTNAQKSLIGGTWETAIRTFDGPHIRITKVIKATYELDGRVSLKGYTVTSCPSGYCNPTFSEHWRQTWFYKTAKGAGNKTNIEFYDFNGNLKEEGAFLWKNHNTYLYQQAYASTRVIYKRK